MAQVTALSCLIFDQVGREYNKMSIVILTFPVFYKNSTDALDPAFSHPRLLLLR